LKREKGGQPNFSLNEVFFIFKFWEVCKVVFTPLKNSIRTADDSSTALPVTDLNGAPLWGADSNLHRYKSAKA
jgi:hypothetical protein